MSVVCVCVFLGGGGVSFVHNANVHCVQSSSGSRPVEAHMGPLTASYGPPMGQPDTSDRHNVSHDVSHGVPAAFHHICMQIAQFKHSFTHDVTLCDTRHAVTRFLYVKPILSAVMQPVPPCWCVMWRPTALAADNACLKGWPSFLHSFHITQSHIVTHYFRCVTRQQG